MTRERFYLHTDNEELIKFLRSQKNISEFLEDTLDRYRTGEIREILDAETKASLDTIFKKLRIENMELKNAELRERLTHRPQPTPEPTPITQSITTYSTTSYQNQKTQKDFDITGHYATHQDQLDGWHATCKHCNFSTQISRDYASEAINDIKPHLMSKHYSEVAK